MNEIVDGLRERNLEWKDALRGACKMNGLSTSLALDLTLPQLKAHYARFQKMYTVSEFRDLKKFKDVKVNFAMDVKIEDSGSKESLNSWSDSWLENELRTFNLILLAVSAIASLPISQFQEREWSQIKQMFPAKDYQFLVYEAVKFSKSNKKGINSWKSEEDAILLALFPKFGDNQWNRIAREIFVRSDKQYFRTGKQCRERWLNHLDPSKKHGPWSIQEDISLIESVQRSGKKWSTIARFLESRTEHMVKNRFNSLMILHRKFYPSCNEDEILVRILKNYRDKSSESQQLSARESPVEAPAEVPVAFPEKQQGNEVYAIHHQVFTPICVFSPGISTSYISPSPIPFYVNNGFDGYATNFTMYMNNMGYIL